MRPNAKWRVFGKLSMMLTAVSIMMTVLSLSGCVSSRKLSETVTSDMQRHEDSTVYVVREIKTETIPMSEVTLRIPADSLLKLPESTSYHAKSGQANLDVRTQGDNIIVYASCDSLQRVCEYYESIAGIYKRGYEELYASVQTENERRSNPVKTAIIAFTAGLASGIVLTILKRKRK